VYRFPRRALTLCPQLCMGNQSSARFSARGADALPATLYGGFAQAIYRNRPIADNLCFQFQLAPLFRGADRRCRCRRRRRRRGRVVQVDPIKPTLKPPGTERLKLNCDVPRSTPAFKFNLRRYAVAAAFAEGFDPVGSRDIREAFDPGVVAEGDACLPSVSIVVPVHNAAGAYTRQLFSSTLSLFFCDNTGWFQ
jgi:hypothetical protein